MTKVHLGELNDNSLPVTPPAASGRRVPAYLRKSLTPIRVQPDDALNRHASRSSVRHRRWGVILAGGDGTRLLSLTRMICGDDRPKQLCPLFGNDSLLEQTRRRAERSIPSEQVLFALTRRHREYYLKELGGRRLTASCSPAIGEQRRQSCVAS